MVKAVLIGLTVAVWLAVGFAAALLFFSPAPEPDPYDGPITPEILTGTNP